MRRERVNDSIFNYRYQDEFLHAIIFFYASQLRESIQIIWKLILN